MIQVRKTQQTKAGARMRAIACVALAVMLICLSATAVYAEPSAQQAAGSENERYMEFILQPNSCKRTSHFGLRGESSEMRYIITAVEGEIELFCYHRGTEDLVFYEKFNDGHYVGYYNGPVGEYEFVIHNNSDHMIALLLWVKTTR